MEIWPIYGGEKLWEKAKKQKKAGEKKVAKPLKPLSLRPLRSWSEVVKVGDGESGIGALSKEKIRLKKQVIDLIGTLFVNGLFCELWLLCDLRTVIAKWQIFDLIS